MDESTTTIEMEGKRIEVVGRAVRDDDLFVIGDYLHRGYSAADRPRGLKWRVIPNGS